MRSVQSYCQKGWKVIVFALFTFTCTLLQAQTYADHSVLANGRWVKIRTDQAGVYQLTSSQLRSMGFSNPDRVRLYGLNLEVLPETMIEKIDDDLVEIPLFRTGDRLLFYGRGVTRWTLSSVNSTSATFTHFNNPYSTSVCYFLTETADQQPKEMEKYAYEVGTSAPTQTTFADHALVESDGFSYLRSGRTFFDQYDFATGKSQNYKIDLPGLVGGSTKVNLAIQFATAGITTSSLEVKVDGDTKSTLTFDPLGEFEYGKLRSNTFSFDAPSAEGCTVNLTHNRVSGISGHLDYLRASYIRHLNIPQTFLLFRPSASGDVIFQLTGGTAETVFWHINKTQEIEEVAGTFDAATGTWNLPFSSDAGSSTAWQSEELVAVNPGASFPSPTVCGAIANQDLHSLRDIDLVIVVPTSGHLATQARRLAEAHTARDGMRCVVLTAQQIYNEFSSGTPDATAVRRLMKMLYDQASTTADRPKNLLMFGPAIWDNRMVTVNTRKYNPDDFLLTYESDGSLHLVSSYFLTEYYALLDNNTTGNVLRWKPRIGVGFIPVRTNAEAKTVVDKLITYINNEQVGNWKNLVCIMADDGNENMHMRDAEAIYKEMTEAAPDIRLRRIYWDTYEKEVSSTGDSYPDAQTDINRQMQEGALVMNYSGHGAAHCLSHELVIQVSDFDRWNSPRLPLWVTAGCDISPFDMDHENIGESALKNPRGAAMGILSTTRTVYPNPNRELNRRFMRYCVSNDANGRQYTLGQALSMAKCELIDISSDPTNKAHFILIGDPAIQLAIPKYKVEIDRINDTYAPGTPYSASAGSLLTVEGHIVDTEGKLADTFNGIIYPIVQDNVETVVCKNNANDDVTPFTFDDRLRTLYTCGDKVEGGKFTFSFPVPLDNNYSGKTGLISLYAVNNEATLEANGRFTNFAVSGTSADLPDDTNGPTVELRLNNEQFQNGDVVNETPLLLATLYDENGLNMTGSGIGHDISAIIDNKEATTYSLNSYFQPTVGDYRRGSLTFPIPALTEGQHSLTLRAYDILNNPSTTSIDFYVNVGATPSIYSLQIKSDGTGLTTFTFVTDRPQTDLDIDLTVYDITGRKLWKAQESGFSISSSYTFSWNQNETDSHIIPGVYIVKANVASNGGSAADIAKKFIIPRSR